MAFIDRDAQDYRSNGQGELSTRELHGIAIAKRAITNTPWNVPGPAVEKPAYQPPAVTTEEQRAANNAASLRRNIVNGFGHRGRSTSCVFG